MPKPASLAEPPFPLTAHLVRHGDVALPEGDRVYGDMEMELSEKGIRQLENVGADLAPLPVVAIYGSDLTRAQVGARSVARFHAGVEVRVERNLREIFRGDWRNLTWAEIDARWPGGARSFVKEPGTYRAHNGETLTDVDRRARLAWERIVADVKQLDVKQLDVKHLGSARFASSPHLVVVSHSWVLRCLVARLLTCPLTAAMGLSIDTGSIQTVEWTGERWRLRCFNRRPADRTPLPVSTNPTPTG